MNPKIRKKMMDEKKKRDRENLKRKIDAGVDFLGDNDLKANERDSKKTFVERIFDKIGSITESLKPFKSDLLIIRANYDRSITLFYEILQQMYLFTLLLAAI